MSMERIIFLQSAPGTIYVTSSMMHQLMYIFSEFEW